MGLLSAQETVGHLISLKTADPRHIGSGGLNRAEAPSDEAAGFGKLFIEALNKVNELQHRSQDMAQAMVTDPDSVDVHDVTIALAEAQMSLSIAKGIIDRAIRAYREITGLR